MYLVQQSDAGGLIEVMQEISDQCDVLWSAEIHAEGAAGEGFESVFHTGLTRVAFRDLEYRRPIDRHDARLRRWRRSDPRS
jgi:hypothetical protein